MRQKRVSLGELIKNKDVYSRKEANAVMNNGSTFFGTLEHINTKEIILRNKLLKKRALPGKDVEEIIFEVA